MQIQRRLLALGLLTVLAACSGKDEPAEPVEDAAKDEAAADADDTAADAAAETPAAEPVPEAAPAPAAAEPLPIPEPPGFEGAKVTKYVTSFALNVRTGPGKEFNVKRHVKWGDKIDVVINGEWAKLGTSEYVSINRLSDTPPKKKTGKKK